MTFRDSGPDSEPAWKIFDVESVRSRMPDVPVAYFEFLRVPSASCAVYRLAVGSRDMQSPHDEDELYYVIEGRAQIRIGEEEREVGAGSILYVRATEQHSFFEILEDMTLLVIFPSTQTGAG